MPDWTQKDVHKHMHVDSSDKTSLGHVVEAYEDSFLVHRGISLTRRYFPYKAIASIEHDHVALTLSADEASARQWEIRPDYEAHLGDPVQLDYDRGHDIPDPFGTTHPDQS